MNEFDAIHKKLDRILKVVSGETPASGAGSIHVPPNAQFDLEHPQVALERHQAGEICHYRVEDDHGYECGLSGRLHEAMAVAHDRSMSTRRKVYVMLIEDRGPRMVLAIEAAPRMTA